MNTSPLKTIRVFVDPSLPDKVDRFFDQSLRTIAVELLQNSRRAGATRVEVTASPLGGGRFAFTLRDDGSGLDDPARLLGFLHSGWDDKTKAIEDPAGCGFFSLSSHGATVRSRDWKVIITRDAFCDKEVVPVLPSAPIDGFEVSFIAEDTYCRELPQVENLFRLVAEHGPLDVHFNGTLIERKDFLGKALLVKVYEGVRIGVHPGHCKAQFNFFGLIIRDDSYVSVQNGDEHSYHVDFDILEASQLRLTLPQRDKVVRNDFLEVLQLEGRRAIFEYIATLPGHRLCFRDYQEAHGLGVKLPEAIAELRPFAAEPGVPENTRGGSPRAISARALICTIQERGLGQTIEWAVNAQPTFPYQLHQPRDSYEGYSWYDQLPRLAAASVLLDGKLVPEDGGIDIDPLGKLPKTISLELKVTRPRQAEQILVVKTNLYIPVIESYPDFAFLITREHPFTDPSACHALEETLTEVFFEYNSDCDADSYDTQYGWFCSELADLLDKLFQGKEQAALNRLQTAVNRNGLGHGLTSAGFDHVVLRYAKGTWTAEGKPPEQSKRSGRKRKKMRIRPGGAPR